MKYKTGDRVKYTPLGENRRSWAGTIVDDPTGDFPVVIGEEWWYLFLADETLTDRPLPEADGA